MYDELAAYYHLIFENWDASIARQAAALGPLIETACGKRRARILDAACGIGTQAIGLALRGHALTGSDLSPAAVERARAEAAARSLAIPLYVADLRDLSTVPGAPFDAVLVADNAFAHLLSGNELRQAAASASRMLNSGGILLATIRDYDILARQRPAIQGPALYSDSDGRRIVHQLWEWTGERDYMMHLYITRETAAGWECLHFVSAFHAFSRAAVTSALQEAGWNRPRAATTSRSCWHAKLDSLKAAWQPTPAGLPEQAGSADTHPGWHFCPR
jgi:SAM-dependent methyltransferase